MIELEREFFHLKNEAIPFTAIDLSLLSQPVFVFCRINREFPFFPGFRNLGSVFACVMERVGLRCLT